MRDRKSNRPFFRLMAGLTPIFVATICCLIYFVGFNQIGQVAAEPVVNTQNQTRAGGANAQTPEERIEQIERTLQSVKDSVEKTEPRGYETKMIAREMIRYVKAMTIILALAAVGFPLSIWLLSRKRLLGLSGLSDEVTATLLIVEERQAKLGNILKDIQGEIDYMHTMSVPDLKNLIQQAEKYLKQNEEDLGKAGLSKEKSKH
jgi:hypothetical protein